MHRVQQGPDERVEHGAALEGPSKDGHLAKMARRAAQLPAQRSTHTSMAHPTRPKIVEVIPPAVPLSREEAQEGPPEIVLRSGLSTNRTYHGVPRRSLVLPP